MGSLKFLGKGIDKIFNVCHSVLFLINRVEEISNLLLLVDI